MAARSEVERVQEVLLAEGIAIHDFLRSTRLKVRATNRAVVRARVDLSTPSIVSKAIESLKKRRTHAVLFGANLSADIAFLW